MLPPPVYVVAHKDAEKRMRGSATITLIAACYEGMSYTDARALLRARHAGGTAEGLAHRIFEVDPQPVGGYWRVRSRLGDGG